MPRHLIAAPVLLATLLLAACANSTSNGPNNSLGETNTASGNNNPLGGTNPPRSDFRALYVAPQTTPTSIAPILPYPTDLYFSGSTDGTLNLPANALQPGAVAVNALDGYSTTAPIAARFSSPIDPASLTATSVYVVRVVVDTATKATVGVSGVLAFNTDFRATVNPDPTTGGSQLMITPVRPLVPSSGTGATNVGYLVVLTNGIRSSTGAAAVPDTDFATIKGALPSCASITAPTLNGICRLVGANMAIATNPLVLNLNPANIIQTFSFSTQNTRDTMNIVAATINAAPPKRIFARPTGLNTAQVLTGAAGKANIMAGLLDADYYLVRTGTGPVTGSWLGGPSALDATSRFLTRFNPIPVRNEILSLPVLFTIPNAASAGGATKPPGGWPVVIFQHGITGDRTQALAIADALADGGFVVASIDQPLHGLTDPMNPLYASPMNPLYAGTALPTGAASFERTFDLDLVNNTTTAPPADGLVDPSGTHFINLSSLLTSRDNARQAATDLLTLTRAIPTLDIDGDSTADINGSRIHFVGISLGGIVGTTYAGLPSALVSITASVPGGGIAYLLRDSASFGPRITGGLAAQGLPSTAFDQFFRDAQTVVDSGDPLNYIASAVALRPYHLQQIIGGGAVLPDQVVPNNSTQRLIVAGNLTKVGAVGLNPVSRSYVNMIQGSHGSLLSPATSLAATVEMQTQAATFAATSGTITRITNAAVVEP